MGYDKTIEDIAKDIRNNGMMDRLIYCVNNNGTYAIQTEIVNMVSFILRKQKEANDKE